MARTHATTRSFDLRLLIVALNGVEIDSDDVGHPEKVRVESEDHCAPTPGHRGNHASRCHADGAAATMDARGCVEVGGATEVAVACRCPRCCTTWQHCLISAHADVPRPRISVTKDPMLAEALERGRRLLDSGAPEATLVRDLAVHGARLLADEQDQRSAALHDLGDPDWLDAVLDPAALDAVEANGLPTTP